MLFNPLTNSLDYRPRILIAFAVCGNLRDAEVNAQNANGFNRRRGRQVNRDVQVENASAKYKVSLAFPAVNACCLIVTEAKRDKFAPCQRQERDMRRKGGEQNIIYSCPGEGRDWAFRPTA